MRAVRTESNAQGKTLQIATVFVPDGQRQYFLSKIEKYLSTQQKKHAVNYKLVESIAAIREATLLGLWTDPVDAFPSDSSVDVWWEVWLAHDGDGAEERRRFAVTAKQNEMAVSDHYLGFAERTVVLVKASVQRLSGCLPALADALAELRRPHEIATFLTSMSATEQADWVEDLRARLLPASDDAPVVCVLDTGVQQGHPLLTDSLRVEDTHAAEATWNSQPAGRHGTEMAGLALFYDLKSAVSTGMPVRLLHRLESVKILASEDSEMRDVFGAVTARAVDRPEIQAPDRARVFLLAVTAQAPPASNFAGEPTAWSAAVDALAFGRSIKGADERFVHLDRDESPQPRLFTVSAGNIGDLNSSDNHLDRSDLEPVEDPAQAWNALTVGAYSSTDDMANADPMFAGYVPISRRGELSAVSRTSVAFDAKNWPFKPEVVADGGNVARPPGGGVADTPENLALLTTRFQTPGQGFFTTTRDTSAAAAQVAAIAADIHATYPTLRPETIRALVVHSAEWTDTMLENFRNAATKSDRASLLRRYGMGVPSAERSLRSAQDALTLIAEAEIHPFRRDDGTQDARADEMNLHELPWPATELRALGEAEVRLRVTLSYFIEPNPSRRGWNGRWAYPSFGLRFAVKRPQDALHDFVQRNNVLARVDDDSSPLKLDTEAGWFFGAHQQQRPGSLHTDIWSGNAADLADKGAVAVFPVSGWWKYRRALDQSDRGVNYSLVVSIESPEVEVDLWTPTEQQIAMAIPLSTTIGG